DDPALTKGVVELLLAVIGKETSRVHEMADRLADLVIAPARFAAGRTPALTQQICQRLIEVPAALPEVARQLLHASTTNDALREDVIDLLVQRLWLAHDVEGSVLTNAPYGVQAAATEAIAELLASSLFTRLHSFLPPEPLG